MSDPIPLGISIFQMFNDAHGKGVKMYKGNNREIQKLHDREPLFFDAEQSNCGQVATLKKNGIDGHFEHLTSTIYDIVFVDGEKPSKLKGTTVVDEKKMKEIHKKI